MVGYGRGKKGVWQNKGEEKLNQVVNQEDTEKL